MGDKAQECLLQVDLSPACKCAATWALTCVLNKQINKQIQLAQTSLSKPCISSFL